MITAIGLGGWALVIAYGAQTAAAKTAAIVAAAALAKPSTPDQNNGSANG